jgi:hypothetical protein
LQRISQLGDGDGILFTNLYTAFATNAFLGIDRDSFIVLEFINIHRANINAFAAAYTFLLIYFRFVTHPITSFIT